MPDIYRRLRKYLPLLLGVAIALLILGKPVFAHAWDPFGLTSIAFDAILDATLGILVTINSLLAQLLNASGEGLKMVLTLNPTANMPVIGDAWRIIRDMCNLIFVVAFIGIAFGTIFNATKWLPTGWHYSSALGPLLIAAILMNFSLAIGKTLVLASNEAAKAVLDVMNDPGGMLVRKLVPNDIAIGGIDLKARAALNAPIANTLQTLTDVETATFQKCLTETRVIHADEGIFWSAIRAMSNNSLYNDQTIQKTQGECLLEIHDARYGTTPAAVAQIGQQPTIPKGTMEQKILYIGNAIFGSLMILLFVSCLLSAAIFLGLRIIMIWVLLATAALAWASYAVPGKKEFFHSWWKHFVAWNVFGPLYLLSLIPGILMLGASGQMTAQLLGLGADISSANLLSQQFFFYVFAVVIFVGGLALSLKSSFSVVSTIKETPILGSFFAAKLGVFEPVGAGSKWTGMTSRARGAVGGLKEQFNQRVAAPMARREAETEALYRARFGGAGAKPTLDKAVQDRIEAAKTKIEAPLRIAQQNLELEASRAAPQDREKFRLRIKALGDQQTERLHFVARTGNRDEQLAATDLLLADGKVSAKELRAATTKYAQISPAALSGFTKKRDAALIKNAPKQKFSDSADLESYLSLIGDPKEAKKYYDAAKGGKNKIMVLEAGHNMKLELKPDGKEYSVEELILKEMPKFKDEDWVATEEYFDKRAQAANASNPNGEKISALDEMAKVGEKGLFAKKFKSRFTNATQRQNMRMAASTPDQMKRIEKVWDDIEDKKEAESLIQFVKNEKATAQSPVRDANQAGEKSTKKDEEESSAQKETK